MTIRDIEIFMKVVECGKMSKAAKKLYISHSAVSQTITEMEKEYNVHFFERLSNRIYLTYAGKELYSYAQRFMNIYDGMCHFLQETNLDHGIRIGATLTVGSCVMREAVALLKKESKDAVTEVFVANTQLLEEKLLANELDVALVEGRIRHPHLMVEPVIEDMMVLICSPQHPFYGRKSVALHELEKQELILREQGSGTRAQLEEELIKRHIDYHVRWTSYSITAIKNAVMDNEGISLISVRLIKEEVQVGLLWQCLIEDISWQRTFDIVYHKDRFIFPTMEKFIQICNQIGNKEWKTFHINKEIGPIVEETNNGEE